jgi:hypothetical protein
MADAVDPAADPKPDPGGPVSGIARYRQLATWVITVFAAVGALLVAGSQLTTLGELDLGDGDEAIRLIAAVLALAVALFAAFRVIGEALEVLSPVDMSLNDLVVDPIVLELNEDPAALPFGADTVLGVRDEFNAAMSHPGNTPQEKEEWRAQVSDLLDRAAYMKVRAAFTSSWRKMGIWAAVAAAAILVFAYAANPEQEEEEDSPSAAAPPTPTAVSVTLSTPGVNALTNTLGEDCVNTTFEAISIGGTEESPLLITVPSETCKLARFTLPSGHGQAISQTTAPVSDSEAATTTGSATTTDAATSTTTEAATTDDGPGGGKAGGGKRRGGKGRGGD